MSDTGSMEMLECNDIPPLPKLTPSEIEQANHVTESIDVMEHVVVEGHGDTNPHAPPVEHAVPCDQGSYLAYSEYTPVWGVYQPEFLLRPRRTRTLTHHGLMSSLQDPDETDAGSSPHTEIAKDLPVEDYFRREEPDVDPRDFVSVFRRFMREQYYTQQDVARQLCCSQAKLSTFLCRKLSPKSFEKTMQMIETWIATTDHQAEYNQRKEKAFHCLLSKRTSKANQSALVFDRFPVDLMRGDGGRYRRPKRKEYAKRPKVKKTKSVEVSTLETNSALLHPSKRVKLALAPKPTGGLSISPILQANTCSQASPVMSAHRYPTQRPPLEPHVHADREGGDGFCSLTVADNIDPLIDTGSLPDNLPQLHYDTYEGCDGLYGVVGLEGDMQDPCSPYLCSVSSALPPVWYGEAETDRAPTTDTLLAGRIPHTHDFDTGDCTLDADTSLHGLWELFSQSPELRNTALPWEAGVCDASGYSSSECLLGDCNLDDAPSQTTNTF